MSWEPTHGQVIVKNVKDLRRLVQRKAGRTVSKGAVGAEDEIPQRSGDPEAVMAWIEMMLQVILPEPLAPSPAGMEVVGIVVDPVVSEVAEEGPGEDLSPQAGSEDQVVHEARNRSQEPNHERRSDKPHLVVGKLVVISVDHEHPHFAAPSRRLIVEDPAVQDILQKGPEQNSESHQPQGFEQGGMAEHDSTIETQKDEGKSVEEWRGGVRFAQEPLDRVVTEDSDSLLAAPILRHRGIIDALPAGDDLEQFLRPDRATSSVGVRCVHVDTQKGEVPKKGTPTEKSVEGLPQLSQSNLVGKGAFV